MKLYEPGGVKKRLLSSDEDEFEPYIGDHILEFQRFMAEPSSRKLVLGSHDFKEITKDLGTSFIPKKSDLERLKRAWLVFESCLRTGLYRSAAFIYSTYIQGTLQLSRSLKGFERQMANTNIKKQDIDVRQDNKSRWGLKNSEGD